MPLFPMVRPGRKEVFDRLTALSPPPESTFPSMDAQSFRASKIKPRRLAELLIGKSYRPLPWNVLAFAPAVPV